MLSGRRVPVLLLVLAIVFPLAGSQVRTEEDGLALPDAGTLDDRPFFASRRHSAIAYSETASTDVVGQLARSVDAGRTELRFEPVSGYLGSVLKALRVPAESQSVVFSKTSLQAHWISPANPRAIFYSDDVSVAFIRNAPLLEISALDPQLGVIFYSLEQKPAERPRIVRSDSCLSCHESRKTLDVPGILTLSTAVGTGGEVQPEFGNFVSDHRRPFHERWGGWFITGRTNSARHMGNTMLTGKPSTARPKTLASLDGQFDLQGYPSRFSDVAAVMTLEHQVGMTNLLTRFAWEARIALDLAARQPQSRAAADRLIAANARNLVDYILFLDEPRLPGRLESTSGFAKVFAAAGPRDSKGRTLREFDLQRRLFRYPCSYMIYSPAFNNLPAAAKEVVYQRLWEILSGREKGAKYARLAASDRRAILEILRDTKKDLPAYFAS